MTRSDVNAARREALFASGLQRSDAPTAAVTEAISTVRQLGILPLRGAAPGGSRGCCDYGRTLRTEGGLRIHGIHSRCGAHACGDGVHAGAAGAGGGRDQGFPGFGPLPWSLRWTGP